MASVTDTPEAPRLRALESIGSGLYQARVMLPRDEMGRLYGDDIEGFKYLVGSCFLRNRHDELSERYTKCASLVLERYKETLATLALGMDNTKEEAVDRIVRDFRREVRLRHPTYGVLCHDAEALRCALEDLLPRLGTVNPVKWTVDSLRSGVAAEEVSRALRFPEFSDKTRGLFLRDVVVSFGLKDRLRNISDFVTVQPIDTWVRQVAIQLWPDLQYVQRNLLGVIRRRIVDRCLSARVCPLAFNQGAWLLGRDRAMVKEWFLAITGANLSSESLADLISELGGSESRLGLS